MKASKNKTTPLSCKLTTPELRKRKATVLAFLREKVTTEKELENGFAFCFPGSDEMLDKLVEFVKSERKCCEFFTFTLSVSDDKADVRLEVTGPEGVKEFIRNEILYETP